MTVEAFLKWNTYPIQEMIIVNDSADENIHAELKSMYPDFILVLNEKNVGLMYSIDLGYLHIKTNYFFHCEDDWMIIKGGFIEQSLSIMEEQTDIEEVWLVDGMNKHPMEEQIYETKDKVKYRLAAKNYYKDKIGFIYGWHGFTTSCALKRISDYKQVAPYSGILALWKGEQTIWHKEHAIGEAYNKLNYRTAALIDDDYAVNIGIGQSEYKTGWEK